MDPPFFCDTQENIPGWPPLKSGMSTSGKSGIGGCPLPPGPTPSVGGTY